MNKAFRNLSYLNKFAQRLRDARFYQRRKDSKKVYNRKKIKDVFLTIKKLILK